jgi:hypothetical protein
MIIHSRQSGATSFFAPRRSMVAAYMVLTFYRVAAT